jgi:hypothetical protein
MKDVLIGAISGNYKVDDISTWVNSSNFDGVERVLLLYNGVGDELETYLKDKGVFVIKPDFNFWGEENMKFTTDTGTMDLLSSYTLVHNVRFFHIWSLLTDNDYDRVLVTDVKDVCFNKNPFDQLKVNRLTASSEVILYRDEEWNQTHLMYNLGLIGQQVLINEPVYNVGVFGGDARLVKDICSDIYLMSCGKPKVADQTSFNYLINTKYKEVTDFTNLDHKFAVHLHVINAGLVPFDLYTIKDYSIVHQYDRLKDEIQRYYTIPK